MKTVFLFRHAKSSWDNPGLSDFDRPLNDRGRKAAKAMGKYMKKEGLKPDLVLSSSSARTRETMTRFQDGFGETLDVEFSDALYLASPGTIFSILRNTPAEAVSAMVLAHNPGMQQAGLDLAGKGKREIRAALAAKYPTAGLVEIEFDVKSWEDLKPGEGTLKRFIRPHDL